MKSSTFSTSTSTARIIGSIFIVVCAFYFTLYQLQRTSLVLIDEYAEQVSGAEDKICKEALTAVLKNQLNIVTQCLDKLGYEEPKERAAKMSCVLKCALTQQGILGDDGLPDPVATLQFLEKTIPDNRKEHATSIIMGCQDAAANVDPKEENCKSYDKIVKCAMLAINKFCE